MPSGSRPSVARNPVLSPTFLQVDQSNHLSSALFLMCSEFHCFLHHALFDGVGPVAIWPRKHEDFLDIPVVSEVFYRRACGAPFNRSHANAPSSSPMRRPRYPDSDSRLKCPDAAMLCECKTAWLRRLRLPFASSQHPQTSREEYAARRDFQGAIHRICLYIWYE